MRRQSRSTPDLKCRHGLLVEALPRVVGSYLGSGERDDQVELRATFENEAHAAQDAIDLPKCAETIDINRRKSLRLIQQNLIFHVPPFLPVRRHHGIYERYATLRFQPERSKFGEVASSTRCAELKQTELVGTMFHGFGSFVGTLANIITNNFRSAA